MDDTRVDRLDSLLLNLQHVFEGTSYALENMSTEIDGLRRELTSIKKAFRKGTTRAVSGGRQLRPQRKSG